MDNGLSASDVALLNGDSGFGNGWGGMIWLFAILALMGGGFGGWGNNSVANALGYENLATSNEVQRGFDNQNLQAQTRDILAAVNSGTAQSVAATNQTFHDSLMANQNLYNEVARDIGNLALGQANLQAQQQNCCCETKQLIMQNNYDGAMRDAQTNANITAQIKSVKDMISQNKIEDLQSKVSALELQAATSNVLRYPNAWTYNAGMSPFCGCNCGM
jgi:hypothetical protein